ncbi:MAG: TAT-variant-translocated molybdopterin oxidoreductase [Bacillota bacterium]
MNNSKNSEESKGSAFWRSLKELGNDPQVNEAKANEFMQGVTDDFKIEELSGVSRRKFLALLSASVAFAAASCTNYKDKGEIIPYNKKPEEITPGIANFYASTCTGCANACGILVKTREGRPIKVDGNPEHPVNQGKICAVGQASVLNLYDPNRLKKPIKISGGSSVEIPWTQIDDTVISALNEAQNSGKQIAVVTSRIVSPSGNKVLGEFKAKYPNTVYYSFEFNNEDVRNNAWLKTYSTGTFPPIFWDQAKVILSLEGDFLGGEGHSIENIRLFALNRDGFNKKEFNRFYQVESALSMTGASADYRMRLRPDAQFAFVLSLLSELNKRLNSPLSLNVNAKPLNDFAKQYGLSEKTVNHLVNDLLSNRGSAIVYAGSKLPEEVHIAVNALNEILGNTKLYNLQQQVQSFSVATQKQQWEELINAMNNGSVGVIIHYDTNPVYHLPQDYGYEQALKKVPLSVSLTEQENETSSISKYTLPVNHDLESWGDYSSRTGVISLQQPVIYPLYSTRQKESIMLVWIAGNKAAWKENIYHDYLANNWEKEIFPALNSPVDFRTFWFTSLENGVVIQSQSTSGQQAVFNKGALSAVGNKEPGKGYVVLLKNNYNIGDGKYANNGWLQELPHPISKVVWDNYAAISPDTAKDLDVDTNDKIEITIGNRKQQFPVFIQPGTADKVIVIETGYGRTKAGDVGTGIGVNANLLMTKNYELSPFVFNNAVQVRPAGGTYKLVTTQEQHSLDDTQLKDMHLKRGIIRQGTVDEFRQNPNFLEKEKREQLSVNKDVAYHTVKWGMGIDLNKCIGCNACVTACDVENNIPVVGKDQVDMGRIMHWFRVDRYYSGTPDDPVVYNQPMLCQHCDTAPCENVCPVAATSHSPDGLNQMAYNRCVGTRYCSNNCPYKVRRFNFFNFRDHFADGYYQQEPTELVFNPEVTVRSRGVMEKCTFCVQRIMLAREKAIEDNRPLKGSDVETACQQACPARAIEFGDVNDPESVVSKHRTHELGYHVLAEINTRPNITYLAKLRNTLPEDKA